MYTHYLKITYGNKWQKSYGPPSVGYAGYESKEKMEECRDNLIHSGNVAVELTLEEYEAALNNMRSTPAEMASDAD